MDTPKATHRSKNCPSDKFFDVGDIQDPQGYVACKYIRCDGSWMHATRQASDLEPIPTSALVPFDYDSWLALLKQHRSEVYVRRDGLTIRSPHFSKYGLWGDSWRESMTTLEYTTDYGETWKPVAREKP